MYDKYNKFLPIPLNTPLPKHKGVFWTTSSSTTGEVYSGSINGGTYSITFTPAINSITPFEFVKFTNLGASGFLLN